MSHPTRVRGLKHLAAEVSVVEVASHPTRVRGLKLASPSILAHSLRRTPRGCVD